jgi:hypothetical protein
MADDEYAHGKLSFGQRRLLPLATPPRHSVATQKLESSPQASSTLDLPPEFAHPPSRPRHHAPPWIRTHTPDLRSGPRKRSVVVVCSRFARFIHTLPDATETCGFFPWNPFFPSASVPRRVKRSTRGGPSCAWQRPRSASLQVNPSHRSRLAFCGSVDLDCRKAAAIARGITRDQRSQIPSRALPRWFGRSRY